MSQTEVGPNTKERILTEARHLFAQHGYSGASIRMIAEQSDVNIAAVNYHFGSKEGLYWSVIDEGYEWIEKGTKKVVAESESIEDLARQLFQFFRESSDYVMSIMKTFMSENIPTPGENHPYSAKLRKQSMGPPGGGNIVVFLKQHYPMASDPAREWVVMCLFSSIFHFASMCSTSHFQNIKKEYCSEKEVVKAITTMAQALVSFQFQAEHWRKSGANQELVSK